MASFKCFHISKYGMQRVSSVSDKLSEIWHSLKPGMECMCQDSLFSIGYNLLPQPGMVLLQERICSLEGANSFL